jgi:tellurium resistance protein TerZ
MSISLAKGQSIDLSKSGGASLRRAHMGTGWDAAKTLLGRQRPIDLDASVMVFGSDRALIDQVWFRQLKSNDGAIVHTGDNRTGKGDGDDESIIVDLGKLDARASTLVFVVNSFSGENFSKVQNAYSRLVDLDTGTELARYSLSQSGPHTAQIMATLHRSGSGWTMTAIGHVCNGRTFRDLIPAAQPFIS